ncbi:Polypeptide N-acetylgalactosaminyltransferase-like 6 [Acipenser ruthenus]|uniref:Polypeptide N-acetylgalactosaminyltransferase-like 6 n=1 Tax=Acipenser ruthenus TaxID=7906 RepID=A0A444UWB1_ACIRT|nr:Polypeptide N-acetylgalactosaminyltransferase-like 6 [Acipenser ruthenus]
MRRKEKRLLQIAGLLIAAILFLPNVGLWSLYRDKVLDNSPEREGGAGSAAAQISDSARVFSRQRLSQC